MKRGFMIAAFIAVLAVVSAGWAELDAGKFTMGVFGSPVKLVGGDVDHSNISPWAGAMLGYTISPLLTITMNGGYGWVRPMDMTVDGIAKHLSSDASGFKTVLIPLLMDLKLNLNPSSKFNPYVAVGGGVLLWDLMLNDGSVNGQQNTPMIDGGLGLEWFVSEAVGIDIAAHYQYLANQDQDMSGLGDMQTGVVEARLGLNFYFGGKRDSDGDGILDKIDNCPNEAEDPDNFQDEDGCQDQDNDKDGVVDTLDRCPNTAGSAENKGCPDIDTDHDGIVNRLDKCRRSPEDKDGFEDEDGCPDFDNDKDGVPDSLDKCREVPGIADNGGCPDVDSDGDGFVDRLDKCPRNPGPAETEGCPQTKEITREGLILRGVNFQVGKAVIQESSWPVLDEVVKSLKEWPEVNIEIQGHTDKTGNAEKNRILSQQRAEAVMAYFIERGIAAVRLTAVGYGPTMPTADNKTASGRAQNRRVELKRIY